MGVCCSNPRLNRSRSASDPTAKKKHAPSFSPVSRDDDDAGDVLGYDHCDPDLEHSPLPTNGHTTHSTKERLQSVELDDDLLDGPDTTTDDLPSTLTQIRTHISLTDVGTMDLLNITVVEPGGESKQMPVMNTLTVSQMKSLIAKHIGIPEMHQQLTFNDQVLQSNKAIAHYDIMDGDTVYLTLSNQQEEAVEITVNYKNGTITKTIMCSPDLKFIEFCHEVHGKIPMVEVRDQQFFYRDLEMRDSEMTLRDYGIDSSCELRFEWKSVI